MNETDTPLTLGATEGTGDRPKKKKTPAKKTPAKKIAKKPAKKTPAKKAPAKKKGGAAKKAKPTKTGTTTRGSAASTSSSKKPGKSSKSIKTKKTPSAGAGATVDPSTLKAAPNYGIARIDQPEKKNHGWYVRLGDKESRTNKFFADKSNGGKNKARTIATAFRDTVFMTLPDRLKVRGSRVRKAETKPRPRKAA